MGTAPSQPLFAVLDQLDSALRDLHGEIGELGERMEPVMVPTPPESASTGANASYNAGLIVSLVESTVAAVRQAQTRLKALRSRVVV